MRETRVERLGKVSPRLSFPQRVSPRLTASAAFMIKIILYVRDFGSEWYNAFVTGKLNSYEENNNIILIVGSSDDDADECEGGRSGC